MTFREKTAEAVNEMNEEQEEYEDEELEGIEVDWDSVPSVKFGTGVFITGELPEGEGNPVILFGDYDAPARDRYLGIVLDNPSLLVDEDENTDGTVVLDTDDDDNTDYRVHNGDSAQTTVKNSAVKFTGNTNLGEVIQPSEFDEDRAIVFVTGGGHVSVARSLDINGNNARQIWNEEGGYATTNGGLIDKSGDETTYARYDVQVPDELLGEEIGIMCDWRSEFEDEEYRERLEEDDDMNDSKWFSVFNMNTGQKLEPREYGEPIQRTFVDDWKEDATAEDFGEGAVETSLTETESEFVESYRSSGKDTDEETVREAVEADADAFDGEPNTEAIVEELAS
jgi:hypothetical protein